MDRGGRRAKNRTRRRPKKRGPLRIVHTLPNFGKPHDTTGTTCWCVPQVERNLGEDGLGVHVVHREQN